MPNSAPTRQDLDDRTASRDRQLVAFAVAMMIAFAGLAVELVLIFNLQASIDSNRKERTRQHAAILTAIHDLEARR